MSEDLDLSATIDGLNRLLSDSLAPELQRQETALERLLEEARQAREHIRGMIEQAEVEVTSPFDAADTGLDQIDGLFDDLGSSLDQVEAAHVSLFQAEIGKAIDRVDETTSQFETIENALNDARGVSEAAMTAAEGQLNQLLGTIEAACRAFANGASEASERLHGASERIEQSVSATDAALQELQTLVDSSLDELQTKVGDEIEEVGSTVNEMLETARQAIGEFCEASDNVLGDLSHTADQLSELFDGKANEILDKVQDLLEVIEKIRPLLEAVEQWT